MALVTTCFRLLASRTVTKDISVVLSHSIVLDRFLPYVS